MDATLSYAMHSYLLVATLVTLAGMDPVPQHAAARTFSPAPGGGKILFSERRREGEREREREKTSGDSSDTSRKTDRQTDRYKI